MKVMLDNKVLVNLYVLSLDKKFEIFIPINEKVGNISKLLSSTLLDSIDFSKIHSIINIQTGEYYNNNDLVRDVNIVNGTNLVLI